MRTGTFLSSSLIAGKGLYLVKRVLTVTVKVFAVVVSGTVGPAHAGIVAVLLVAERNRLDIAVE